MTDIQGADNESFVRAKGEQAEEVEISSTRQIINSVIAVAILGLNIANGYRLLSKPIKTVYTYDKETEVIKYKQIRNCISMAICIAANATAHKW
jgi:hypothetical protein